MMNITFISHVLLLHVLISRSSVLVHIWVRLGHLVIVVIVLLIVVIIGRLSVWVVCHLLTIRILAHICFVLRLYMLYLLLSLLGLKF